MNTSRKWREAGCPSEGPSFKEKGKLRSAVKRRVRFCAVKEERKRLQRRKRMFTSKERGCFTTPQRKKVRCSKLIVEGEIVCESEALLDVWAQHLGKLA